MQVVKILHYGNAIHIPVKCILAIANVSNQVVISTPVQDYPLATTYADAAATEAAIASIKLLIDTVDLTAI